MTPTPALIRAMRILARDIHSEDGVANQAIEEAALRLEELDDNLTATKRELAEANAAIVRAMDRIQEMQNHPSKFRPNEITKQA
jgi:hypothetical protein